MDNEDVGGKKVREEATVEDIKELPELKVGTVIRGSEMAVDAITVEELEEMPQVDLIKKGKYGSEPIHNSPKDMESILASWTDIDSKEKEVDREIYYLLRDGAVEELIPGVFNPEYKEIPYEDAEGMEFGEIFVNEILRLQLRSLFDEKIMSDNSGVNLNNDYYQNLEDLFDIHKIERYVKERNISLEGYEANLKSMDVDLEETFNTISSYLNYKLKQIKGETVDINKLGNFKRDVMGLTDQCSYLIGYTFETYPEIRDCMEIQLRKEFLTRYGEAFSVESKRRLKFWRDFISEGYSKERAEKELDFRKGGLY